MSVRVLDVGQCSFDHASLNHMLSTRFGAQVDRAEDFLDVQTQLAATRYDLILVNRLLDRDGSSGLELIRQLKSTPEWSPIPVMLVSNYPDAQQAAVRLGAHPGFGKAQLNSPATVSLLEQILARPTPT